MTVVANSGGAAEDSRDFVLEAPDLEDSKKDAPPPPPDPPSLELVPVAAAPCSAAPPVKLNQPASVQAVGTSKPKGIAVGGAAKKKVVLVEPVAAAKKKGGRPPLSPTSKAAAAHKVRKQHLQRTLGLKKMSAASASGSEPHPISQSSHVESDSLPISGLSQPESVNDSHVFYFFSSLVICYW